MKINVVQMKKKAKDHPPGYVDIVMNNRIPALDEIADGVLRFVVVENDRVAAIREWKKNPGKPIAAQQDASKIRPRYATPQIPEGAGTQLKNVLANLGINPSPDCPCNAHAREMDERGTWWCEQNIETIVGWLRAEAKRKKLPFIDLAGRTVVKRSIRNAVAKRAPRYAMHLSATGLGDAICGLYAACGLADTTGERVIYYAHSHEWLGRAKHPGVIIQPLKAIGVDAGPGAEYWNEIMTHPTRCGRYCRTLAKALGLPFFPHRRPPTIDTSVFEERDEPYILLAPFAAYDSRSWNKWTELANELHAAGKKVVAIGSQGQRQKLEEAFRHTHATWIFGATPGAITDLMLGAEAVVANDSGIAHLGGLLGVPTLSIHAGCLPHDFLFDMAPSVRSVTPRREIPRSDHNPTALREVAVSHVMDAIIMPTDFERMQVARSRSLLGGKLNALLKIVQECGVNGDIAELGVYRGGGTAAMALTCPDRTVHAFDTFEGMPNLSEQGDFHKAGEFSDTNDVKEYLAGFENVRVHPGIFPASADGFDARFAVVHLDADLYASTLAGLKWFWPRMVTGGRIVLDDWEWDLCKGVRKAVEEFFEGVMHSRTKTAGYQLCIQKP